MTRKKVSRRKSTRKTSATGSKSRSKTVQHKATFMQRLRNRLKHLVILSVLLGMVVTLFYAIYLNREVEVKFTGKRWAVPARVYGRPLELYSGADISQQQLKAELRRLGYRHQKHPQSEGTWGVAANRYLVNTRAFDFWDESLPAMSLQITYANNSIAEIRNRNTGLEEAVIRLEAPMIDSIYPGHNEDRILLRREQLPQLLVDTLIAVEDRDFYSHRGINPKSIARAMFANIMAGQVVQGGSTLTQQLVKNFFLTSERSLTRKFNEALMALIIDARYEKDEILEAYANEIYLGQQGRRAIHGFGLASRFYFNRPLQELDVSRIALLVGMIKGPSYYNPLRNTERALKRRNLVLSIMNKEGLITADEMQDAQNRNLGTVTSGAGSQRGYPAFIKLVRNQLKRDYRESDLTSEGLRIFTTLDPWVQENAEKHAAKELDVLEKRHKLTNGKLQVGAVIANPSNGEVLGVVGGRNSEFSGFNRALDAVRPIGSLIKPFVYLTALKQPQDYSLLSPLRDEAVSIRQRDGTFWQPKNYDGKMHGEVALQLALARSYNLATVNLGLDLGLETVIATLHDAGVKQDIRALPSLLLGSLSLSPLEVTQLYQSLAGGGFRSPLRAIREVMDHENRPLSRYPLEVRQTLPSDAVYLLNTALQAVMNEGTGRALKSMLPSSYPLAGKTGTTNDLRDSWFAGFGNNMVAAVWVGRDDNSVAGLTGSQGAMKVWGRIMQSLSPQPLNMPVPAGIQWVWIDRTNGLLGDETCTDVVKIPFSRNHLPAGESSCGSGSVGGFFKNLFD